MEINAQFAYIDLMFGASLSARLKELTSTQMAIGEGVHVRVLISPSRSLSTRSISFFLGERTTGEDLSAHVIVTVFFDVNMFAIMVKPVGADPTTAEIIETPDHVDHLRALANAFLQQDSLGTSACLSWLQMEQLAKGEQVRMISLHPAQPSLPPALLRQGVSASQAVVMPPLLDSDALSQEEIANSDGLRAIAPNTATSGDRFGLHDMSMEDWKRKKEEDKKARKIRREYLTNEEIESDEEEEEKEKELIVDLLEVDTTPRSDPLITPPIAASPRLNGIPPSPPVDPTQPDGTPLPEDDTQRGSPPPSAAPAAAPPPPAAPAAAPPPPPAAALAGAAVSPSPAASGSVSPPPRRSPRLNGTPPSPSAVGSPRRSRRRRSPPSSPSPLRSPTAVRPLKRSASPPASDAVTDDDDTPVHSPRKSPKLDDVPTRSRKCKEIIEQFIENNPRLDKYAHTVNSKVAGNKVCGFYRSMAATMRIRYQSFISTGHLLIRTINENLLRYEEDYDEIEDCLNKYDVAKKGIKEIHDLAVAFSKSVHSEFARLNKHNPHADDLVYDDEDFYLGKHRLFKKKAAAHLDAMKEWHQSTLALHFL